MIDFIIQLIRNRTHFYSYVNMRFLIDDVFFFFFLEEEELITCIFMVSKHKQFNQLKMICSVMPVLVSNMNMIIYIYVYGENSFETN